MKHGVSDAFEPFAFIILCIFLVNFMKKRERFAVCNNLAGACGHGLCSLYLDHVHLAVEQAVRYKTGSDCYQWGW
jgi:hypothetical protein